MTVAQNLITLRAQANQEVHVFLQFPKDKANQIQQQNVELSLINQSNSVDQHSVPLPVVGPDGNR